MTVRDIKDNELSELLALYTHLHTPTCTSLTYLRTTGIYKTLGRRFAKTRIIISLFAKLTASSFHPVCA